jgi:hypothetical protein
MAFRVLVTKRKTALLIYRFLHVNSEMQSAQELFFCEVYHVITWEDEKAVTTLTYRSDNYHNLAAGS